MLSGLKGRGLLELLLLHVSSATPADIVSGVAHGSAKISLACWERLGLWLMMSAEVADETYGSNSSNRPRPFSPDNINLYDAGMAVWRAVSAAVIIGPYFFEDGNERAVTVNGERYRQMLQTFKGALNRDDMRFQQYGATIHTARDTLRLLINFFPGRIISWFGDINWPARSPDLTAPDFFLWGHLKARVFQTRSHSIQDLKNRIQAEVQEINETPGLLQSVMNNFHPPFCRTRALTTRSTRPGTAETTEMRADDRRATSDGVERSIAPPPRGPNNELASLFCAHTRVNRFCAIVEIITLGFASYVIEFLVAEEKTVINIHNRSCKVHGRSVVDRSSVGRQAKEMTASGRGIIGLHDLPPSGRPAMSVSSSGFNSYDAR
ncbi:hypothetical protein ANN_11247 [Periplaneta americana]|uniref:Uncharacterized protein n=1 Tax=Periplaneta americana TaxID=6978 RepID=A0ABQ8T664_PERAM|nr:hypothetical protein ANN_11247 [Periplaneta americana]